MSEQEKAHADATNMGSQKGLGKSSRNASIIKFPTNVKNLQQLSGCAFEK